MLLCRQGCLIGLQQERAIPSESYRSQESSDDDSFLFSFLVLTTGASAGAKTSCSKYLFQDEKPSIFELKR